MRPEDEPSYKVKMELGQLSDRSGVADLVRHSGGVTVHDRWLAVRIVHGATFVCRRPWRC
jgi:hypothetical protein